jgi:hypothetical protein
MSSATLVYLGFIVLPLAVATMISWAAKSRALALTILLWMLLAAALAQLGVLQRFNATPPPIAIFLLCAFIGTVAISRSDWVRHLVDLPLGILIAFHAFRIVVELLLHESSTIGLCPPQMTWRGYNFDVATGLTALVLAPFARTWPRWLVIAWSFMGLALLAVVVTVAVVSFPTRFQLMRPDNTWVASFPYVWLPAILVTAALLGHLIIFRKLASARTAALP